MLTIMSDSRMIYSYSLSHPDGMPAFRASSGITTSRSFRAASISLCTSSSPAQLCPPQRGYQAGRTRDRPNFGAVRFFADPVPGNVFQRLQAAASRLSCAAATRLSLRHLPPRIRTPTDSLTAAAPAAFDQHLPFSAVSVLMPYRGKPSGPYPDHRLYGQRPFRRSIDRGKLFLSSLSSVGACWSA